MPFSNAEVETVSIRPGRRKPRKARRDMAHPFDLPQKRWWRNGECPTRDSFRQRSYNAEQAIADRWGGQKFENIKEARYFLRKFMESAYFQARFPDFTTCVVEWNPRMRGAHAGPRAVRRDSTGEKVVQSGRMTVGRNVLRELWILHELAHAVLPPKHQHDRRWLRTYMEFVRSGIGLGAYQALRDACKREGLRYNPWRQGGGAPPAQLRLAATKAAAVRRTS